MIVSLAGPEAERSAGGTSQRFSRDDEKKAWHFARSVVYDDGTSQAYLTYGRAEAAGLLRTHWPVAVAAELMKHGTIDDLLIDQAITGALVLADRRSEAAQRSDWAHRIANANQVDPVSV